MSNASSLESLYVSSCASEDIHWVFTSFVMYFNHFLMFAIILASYYTSIIALIKLRCQNIFSDSTRLLLFTALVNGLLHQGTYATIRGTAVYKAMFNNDPCSLLFRTSDCFVQIIIYYHTNLFSSICCVSLFLDRVLSRNPRSFYHKHKNIISIGYIVLQVVIPAAVLYWVFAASTFTGYVPMCNYPPANANERFYLVSEYRFGILFVVLIASAIMHWMNKKRERRIIHNDYDTESRYKSYESFLATKAICIIILSQVLCLVATSIVPILFDKYRDFVPQKVHHSVIAFMAGLTYANFLVPLIITHQTNQISERRHEMINRLRAERDTADDHFASLKASWG